MLPDGVSNPGPLTYESGALLIALRGPASDGFRFCDCFEKENLSSNKKRNMVGFRGFFCLACN